MKTILRNLFYTLKRFQTASMLNLMGLSAAFAAFVLLMMKVSYERDFDTCYPYGISSFFVQSWSSAATRAFSTSAP